MLMRNVHVISPFDMVMPNASAVREQPRLVVHRIVSDNCYAIIVIGAMSRMDPSGLEYEVSTHVVQDFHRVRMFSNKTFFARDSPVQLHSQKSARTELCGLCD